MEKDEKIIGIIESNDFEQISYSIIEKASIWMVCGFVSEANILLELFWNVDNSKYQNTFYSIGAFHVFWNLTNSKPQNVPYELQAINEIEQENWNRHFWPHWKENILYQNRSKNIELENYKGIDFFYHAIQLAYDEAKQDKKASSVNQIKALKGIQAYINSEKPLGYDLMHALICGAILAAGNNCIIEAKMLLRNWAINFKEYSYNTSTSWIMRDPKIAKILLDGFLSIHFNISKDLCETEIEMIRLAFKDRLAHGLKYHFNQLTWKELLNELSKYAVKSKYFETIDGLNSERLINLPTNIETIKKHESRLNVSLPQDYKRFLLTSNGLKSYSSTCPTLIPINKIDFLKNIEPELVEIFFEVYNEHNSDQAKSFENSILIGGLKEEQKLLLIPDKYFKNWKCWFFANWNPGETEYRSFRFYIESELLELKNEKNS